MRAVTVSSFLSLQTEKPIPKGSLTLSYVESHVMNLALLATKLWGIHWCLKLRIIGLKVRERGILKSP